MQHDYSIGIFLPLKLFGEISEIESMQSYLVYAGDEFQDRALTKVVGWKQAGHLMKDLERNRK